MNMVKSAGPKYRRLHDPRGYRGMPKRMHIIRKSKRIIRWLIKNPWIRPMCVLNYAAIVVQKVYRGYLVRKFGSGWKSELSKRHKHSNVASINKSRRSREGMLNKYLFNLDYYRENNLEVPICLQGGFSIWCVVRIQAWWRMVRMILRFRYYKHIFYHIAALDIQSCWRDLMHRRSVRLGLIQSLKPINDSDHAASLIQLCWRSFCNRRIYKYFHDLIKYKLQGEPSDLLRIIAPGEADLLDRAAGIHVRFRLGGAIFPPKVYYKIYTHRPLCDVNAFAPRNYSQEQPTGSIQSHLKYNINSNYVKKQQANIRVGNKNFDTIQIATKEMNGWYQRYETNNWRSISSQQIEDALNPSSASIKYAVASGKPFHYTRLRQKGDVEKMKRLRKRKWMMKAYLITASNVSSGSPIGRAVTSTDTPDYNNTFNKGNNREWDSDMFFQGNRVATAAAADITTYNDESKEKGYYMDEGWDMKEKGNGSPKGAKASQRISWRESKQDLPFIPPANSKQDILGNGKYNHNFTSENKGSDEDLLMWSMALDYDNYTKEWQSLGTSLPSDVKYRRAVQAATTTVHH